MNRTQSLLEGCFHPVRGAVQGTQWLCTPGRESLPPSPTHCLQCLFKSQTLASSRSLAVRFDQVAQRCSMGCKGQLAGVYLGELLLL